MCRLIILTFIAALAFTTSKAEAQTNPDTGVNGQIQRLDERLTTVERAADTETTYIARSDLAAQQSMAASAEAMLTLSIIQLVFGVAGAVGLFWTVFLTRRSVRLSRSTLEEQRETNQRQLRAYLGVTDVKIERFGVGQRVIAKVLVKNFGQTPANNIRTSLAVRYHPGSEPPDFSREAYFPPYSIPPGSDGGSTRTMKIALTQEQIDLVENDLDGLKGVIMVSGHITYTDVFDEPQEIEFANHFFGENAGRSVQYSTNNSAT